jgi:hypothetical protein
MRSLGTAVRALLSPLSVILLIVGYFLLLHHDILHNDIAWALSSLFALAPLPALALEIGFTRRFEARAHGWSRGVIIGLAARLTVVLALFAVLVFGALRYSGSHDDAAIYVIGEFPFLVYILWVDRPALSLLVGLALGALYVRQTVQRRRLRFWTTMALPALATFALFFQVYFHPTSLLSLDWRRSPDAVERVFPRARYAPRSGDLADLAFPRGLYVDPGERWAVATFGPSWGTNTQGRDLVQRASRILWVDLAGDEYQAFPSFTTRGLSSDCPSALYAGAWEEQVLQQIDPEARTLRHFDLPAEVDGHAIREIMHVHHVCEKERVFVANSVLPFLVAWDTRAEATSRVVDLRGWHGVRVGTNISALASDLARGLLYVVIPGRAGHGLMALDLDTLQVRGHVETPHAPWAIALSPDGGRIYLSSFLKTGVWVIDADAGRVIDHLPGPASSRALAVSPDGQLLFVAGYTTADLAIYDARGGERLGEIRVSPKMEALSVTPRALYALASEGLFRIPLDVLRGVGSGQR